MSGLVERPGLGALWAEANRHDAGYAGAKTAKAQVDGGESGGYRMEAAPMSRRTRREGRRHDTRVLVGAGGDGCDVCEQRAYPF